MGSMPQGLPDHYLERKDPLFQSWETMNKDKDYRQRVFYYDIEEEMRVPDWAKDPSKLSPQMQAYLRGDDDDDPMSESLAVEDAFSVPRPFNPKRVEAMDRKIKRSLGTTGSTDENLRTSRRSSSRRGHSEDTCCCFQ